MIQRIQNSKWVFVLISVFLAVIFWMYVRNDLDPPGSRTILSRAASATGTFRRISRHSRRRAWGSCGL